MMPFGGFDMPIEYTTIIEEHNAVRHAAGIFDVSHMGEILITGPTNGALFATVEEIRVDMKSVPRTVKGEHFSIKTEHKIRPSDKLYKWVDTTRNE